MSCVHESAKTIRTVRQDDGVIKRRHICKHCSQTYTTWDGELVSPRPPGAPNKNPRFEEIAARLISDQRQMTVVARSMGLPYNTVRSVWQQIKKPPKGHQGERGSDQT